MTLLQLQMLYSAKGDGKMIMHSE